MMNLENINSQYPVMNDVKNISIITKPMEEELKKLLKQSPEAIYVEDDEIEVDLYTEVSFSLKDGSILQNAVGQKYLTRTVQGSQFVDYKETIDAAIKRLDIHKHLDAIIVYTSRYKEKKGVILLDSEAIMIIEYSLN